MSAIPQPGADYLMHGLDRVRFGPWEQIISAGETQRSGDQCEPSDHSDNLRGHMRGLPLRRELGNLTLDVAGQVIHIVCKTLEPMPEQSAVVVPGTAFERVHELLGAAEAMHLVKG